jgi:hypothetical protein
MTVSSAYVGRLLAALKSLDRDERVLYAGSFSKGLFPGLRLGYLVAGGAGRAVQPSGLVRLACRRPAAERPEVGDSAGLGRTARAAGAGAGTLIAALAVLAAHFGYGVAKRAS